MCLKQWRDCGVSLFVDGSSYTISDGAQLIANRGASDADAYVIGADIDGEPLQMAQSTGQLYSSEGADLGVDLAQALGMLRHFAIAKQIEWADGWIEKS